MLARDIESQKTLIPSDTKATFHDKDMPQNESLAYLMFGLIDSHGVLYGPAAIICREPETEKRFRNWIKLLAADWIPDTDKFIKNWWKQKFSATRHALECIERDKAIPELQKHSNSSDDD